MEIRLGTITRLEKEFKIDFHDQLSLETYKKFQEASREIEDLYANRRLLEIVMLNFQELHEFIEPAFRELITQGSTMSGAKRKNGDKFTVRINRLFLNYLSSVRTFQDHSQLGIDRKFGKDSTVYEKYKSILGVFYDQSFAYRFFNKLRNYAQHCGLPLEDFGYTLQRNQKDGGAQAQFHFVFDRDSLLKAYDGWGKKVREDLQTKEKHFEVWPLVHEMTHNIIQIGINIEILNKDRLMHSINFIEKLAKNFRGENIEVCIFKNITTDNDGKVVNFEIDQMPFETMEILMNSKPSILETKQNFS